MSVTLEQVITGLDATCRKLKGESPWKIPIDQEPCVGVMKEDVPPRIICSIIYLKAGRAVCGWVKTACIPLDRDGSTAVLTVPLSA